MERYGQLFENLKKISSRIKKQKKGSIDEDTKQSTYSKLTSLYQSSINQPITQALVLLNKARCENVFVNPVEEARSYAEAGKLFLNEEILQFARAQITFDEHLHMAILSFESARKAYCVAQEHTEAANCCVFLADSLKRLNCNDSSAEWYCKASELYLTALKEHIPSPSSKRSINCVKYYPIISSLESAADQFTQTSDIENLIIVLQSLISHLIDETLLEHMGDRFILSSLSLIFALLVEKLHDTFDLSLSAFVEKLEEMNCLHKHTFDQRRISIEPLLNSISSHLPLIEALASVCRDGSDLESIEILCQQLACEFSPYHTRIGLLLLYIANVYKCPNY